MSFAVLINCQFYVWGDQCIHVLPGDRLGLFFITSVAPVYYGLNIFHDQSKATEFPTVGDTLQFKKEMTVIFLATGFVYVSKYSLVITQQCAFYNKHSIWTLHIED